MDRLFLVSLGPFIFALLGCLKEAFNNWNGNFIDLKEKNRCKKTIVGSLAEIGLLLLSFSGVIRSTMNHFDWSGSMPGIVILLISSAVVTYTLLEDKYKRFDPESPGWKTVYLPLILTLLATIGLTLTTNFTTGFAQYGFILSAIFLAVGVIGTFIVSYADNITLDVYAFGKLVYHRLLTLTGICLVQYGI